MGKGIAEVLDCWGVNDFVWFRGVEGESVFNGFRVCLVWKAFPPQLAPCRPL